MYSLHSLSTIAFFSTYTKRLSPCSPAWCVRGAQIFSLPLFHERRVLDRMEMRQKQGLGGCPLLSQQQTHTHSPSHVLQYRQISEKRRCQTRPWSPQRTGEEEGHFFYPGQERASSSLLYIASTSCPKPGGFQRGERPIAKSEKGGEG